MMNDEFQGSPKTWPPLGLPVGSVRALLTLIVLSVVLTNLAWGRKVDDLWIQTLLIALAHYFTSRRFISLPPDVIERLEQEGLIERERHPLFLPRSSIRTLIIASFIGLAVYLYRVNPERLLNPHVSQASALLGIVFCYLLGAIVGGIGHWFRRRRVNPPSGTWGDLKALVVLIVLVLAAVPEFLNQTHNLPPIFHQIALGMMLFYYGSR